eukprot:3994101-Amphidinium_carterae.1
MRTNTKLTSEHCQVENRHEVRGSSTAKMRTLTPRLMKSKLPATSMKVLLVLRISLTLKLTSTRNFKKW